MIDLAKLRWDSGNTAASVEIKPQTYHSSGEFKVATGFCNFDAFMYGSVQIHFPQAKKLFVLQLTHPPSLGCVCGFNT
jgi:uncharacterized membrane protein YoaT (DUF817 family)